MTIQESKEKRIQQFTIAKFTYANEEEAGRLFNDLSPQQKQQMASVYQKAFGGPPWFEKYICPACGNYQKSNSCPRCGNSNLPDAYQTQDLLKKDFPNMLSTFRPGVLLLVTISSGEIVGFSTGGMTTLQRLIDKKYAGNKQILDDITRQSNTSLQTKIFYDNETCIDPAYQQFGIGKRLSEERLTIAIELGATTICGRTINLPWLDLKRKQLNNKSFSFQAFNPNGDTYEMDGVNRQFYIAKVDTKRRKNP